MYKEYIYIYTYICAMFIYFCIIIRANSNSSRNYSSVTLTRIVQVLHATDLVWFLCMNILYGTLVWKSCMKSC